MPSVKRHADRLSPSDKHLLMAGQPDDAHLAPARLSNWLTTLLRNDAELEQIWREHRAELIAEAKAGGFVPAGVLWFERKEAYGSVLPRDPARERWSAEFCREHGY